MDILSPGMMYPCEPATDTVLFDAIWFASQGSSQFSEKLRTIVLPLSIECIPWFSVYSMSVLGNASNACNTALKEESHGQP